MAGQIPTRREVLEALTLASLAAFAPGFVRWSSAQAPHQHPALLVTPEAPSAYRPVAFDAVQYATMEGLCDLILPADGPSPGAAAAGVSEFVDFMVARDAALQAQFYGGLRALDALSRKVAGADFARLSPDQANAVLTRIAYRRHSKPGDEAAQQFFHLARKYTVMGFYTSEIGFQALDSPNLKFYSESPGCPNPQDLTHHHTKGAPTA